MDDHAFGAAALETLPALFYRSPEIFAHETDALFRRTWQLVGREADLARPGDYLADDVGGAAVVAVRTQDGGLRAFHNLCRHRAGPLVTEGRGNCGGELVCRYHGWRYTLDGRLRAAVDFGPAQGFDPRRYGLLPIQAGVWRGLVFVNLDLDAPSLDEAMAPLEAVWESHAVEMPAGFARQARHELGCDWKVYVENFLEGYHLPAVHPLLGQEVDTRGYRVCAQDGVVVQQAIPLDNRLAANRGLWIWMWPNLGISLYRGGLMVERMSPAAFGRTRLDYFYFHDQQSGVDFDRILEVSARTTGEDIVVCEQVQRRLSAGIYERGVLSPHHEAGVAFFQGRIRELHKLAA